MLDICPVHTLFPAYIHFLALIAHSIRLWLETLGFWVRIPAGSDICYRSCAYIKGLEGTVLSMVLCTRNLFGKSRAWYRLRASFCRAIAVIVQKANGCTPDILHVLSCLVLSCLVLSCLVLSCLVLRVLSCLVLSCLVLRVLRVLSCLVLSCLVLSCLVLRVLRVLSCVSYVSCLVLSCLVLLVLRVLSCLVLSCLVLSCLVLSCLVLTSSNIHSLLSIFNMWWAKAYNCSFSFYVHRRTWHFQVDRDLSEYDEQSFTSIDVSYFTSALIHCLIYTSALTHLSFSFASALKQQLLIMLTLNPLSPTMDVFNPCYHPTEKQLLQTNCVFKHQYLQIVGFKLKKYEYFSPAWSCGSR